MHCPLLPYSPHWPPCPIAKCEGEKPAASLQLGGKSRPNIFYGVVTIPASTIKNDGKCRHPYPLLSTFLQRNPPQLGLPNSQPVSPPDFLLVLQKFKKRP